MSVLVKGMKMPMTCTLCDLAHALKTSDGTARLACAVVGKWQDNYTFRPMWCPLKEVEEQDVNKMEKARKRTGKWILAGVEEVVPGVPYLTKQCSRCGYFHSLRIPDNYCPKCGSHNAGNYDPSIEEFLTAYYNRTKNEKGKTNE